MDSKTYGIVVGPDAKDQEMYKDDNLLLAFAESCHFCVTEGDATQFDPELPHGRKFKAGEVWPADGEVATAKTAGTIKWTHRKNKPCDKGTSDTAGVTPDAGGGHSIVIGG